MCFSGVPSLSPSTSSEVQWLIPLASSLYSISQNHLTVAFLINHYTRLTGSNPNSLLHSACLLSINFSFNIKHHDLIMFTSLVFNSTSCLISLTRSYYHIYLYLFIKTVDKIDKTPNNCRLIELDQQGSMSTYISPSRNKLHYTLKQKNKTHTKS